MDSSKKETNTNTKTTTNDMKDQAKAVASSVKDQATDEIETRASKAQESIASEVSGTADALRKAAEDVRDGSPQGSAFSYAAERLADVSDSIRDQDIGQVMDNVTHYARRHPIAFLGGAAALGMMAARFAKSSTPAGATAQSQQHATQAGPSSPTYGTTPVMPDAAVPEPTTTEPRNG